MGWFTDGLRGILNAPFDIINDAVDAITGKTEADEIQADLEAQAAASAAMTAAEAEAARQKTERDIQYAEAAFTIDQQDAIEKASDIEDQARDIDINATQQESLLAGAFKNNIAQIGSSIDEVHLAEQQAKIGQNQKVSSFRAAVGASGVRSGSTQDKVIVQNTEAFQQALDQSNKASDTTVKFNISSMLQNLQGNRNTLEQARGQANEAYSDAAQLRSDYSEGGRAVNLFRQQISNSRADMNSRINLSQLSEQFKQEAYARAIDRAKWTWEDGMVNIFQVAGAGLGMASSLYNLSAFMPKDFFKASAPPAR